MKFFVDLVHIYRPVRVKDEGGRRRFMQISFENTPPVVGKELQMTSKNQSFTIEQQHSA